MKTFILLSSVVCFLPTAFAAPLCQKWSEPKQIGSLDSDILPEQSGMAFSKKYPGRLYHINDHGDGPQFYVTGPKGGKVKTVKFKGHTPEDLEDVVVGPCGSGESCLYLADIGDNDFERDTLQLVLFEEKANPSEMTKPKHIVEFQYPEEKFDTEALVVSAQGDVYFFTKESSLDRTESVSEIFRLTKSQVESDEVETLSKVGEINLEAILDHEDKVTSASLSPEGTRLLLLTQQGAVEASVDFSLTQKRVNPISESKSVPVEELEQQESIVFLPEGKGFLYGSEGKKEDAPLMQVDCLEY